LRLRTVALLVWFPASGVCAGGWEVELSAARTSGPSVVTGMPFTFEGVVFDGPYQACSRTLDGTFDCINFPPYPRVEFRLQDIARIVVPLGVHVRRHINRVLSVEVGGLAMLGAPREFLLRDVSYGPPTELPNVPPELEAYTFGPNRFLRSGFGQEVVAARSLRVTPYLFAATRWGRDVVLSSADLRLFVDLGAGWLANLPDDGHGGTRSSPAAHAGAGVRWKRSYDRALTFEALYVRGFETPGGGRGTYRFSGLRLGYVWTATRR